MMARSAHWRRLAYLALTGDQPRAMWIFPTLLLLIAVLGFVFDGPTAREAYQYGGAALAGMAGLLWVAFCSGAAMQNTPANAHLVPGLNRAVRTGAVVGWLLTMAAMLPLAYGDPDGALLLPLLGFAVSALGLSCAGRADALAVLIAAVLFYVVGTRSAPLMQAMSQPLAVALAMLASLGYGAWALPNAFPRAGERHWKSSARQRASHVGRELYQWNKSVHGGAGLRGQHGWLPLRDLPRGGAVGDMLLYGLGLRRRYELPVLLTGWVLILLMVKPVLWALDMPMDTLGGVVQPLLGGFIMALALYWMRFAVRIRITAGEQVVLLLAPAMPATPAFNRVLGQRIFATCIIEWAVIGALVLAAIFWFDGSAQNYRVVILIAAMALAGTSLSLQNFARRAQMEGVKPLFLLIWMLFLVVAGSAVRDGMLWAIIVALLGATSLALIVLRWRRMQRGPVAFPANRMD